VGLMFDQLQHVTIFNVPPRMNHGSSKLGNFLNMHNIKN
jgi:hypothetical protein